MKRRTFLAELAWFLPLFASANGAASFSALGCKRVSRCQHCGMAIVATSPWRTELVGPQAEQITAFDTPRCALTSWRTGGTVAKAIRVQEYYSRQVRDGRDVRFVAGGDVLGPMGRDLVPVDKFQVAKFIEDHKAEKAFELEELTAQVLATLDTR